VTNASDAQSTVMADRDPFSPSRDPSEPLPPPLLGGARTPGPLGLGEPDESGPVQLQGGKPASQTKTVELSIVADFPNPYGGLAKEVDAIKNGRWGPTTDDFTDIVVNALKCASFASFGAAILLASQGKERPKASIRRINLFTHANPDLIAFKGTVKPLTIGVDVLLEVGSGLNSTALGTWNAQGFFLEDPATKKQYTLADIQARFTGKSAEIWLYACHSGVDGALVQDIASTFQVTVIGFTDAIAYCPTFTESPPSINRRRLGVKDCRSPVTDFHNLSTSNIVKKTP
jgi:hypothetical protein